MRNASSNKTHTISDFGYHLAAMALKKRLTDNGQVNISQIQKLEAEIMRLISALFAFTKKQTLLAVIKDNTNPTVEEKLLQQIIIAAYSQIAKDFAASTDGTPQSPQSQNVCHTTIATLNHIIESHQHENLTVAVKELWQAAQIPAVTEEAMQRVTGLSLTSDDTNSTANLETLLNENTEHPKVTALKDEIDYLTQLLNNNPVDAKDIPANLFNVERDAFDNSLSHYRDAISKLEEYQTGLTEDNFEETLKNIYTLQFILSVYKKHDKTYDATQPHKRRRNANTIEEVNKLLEKFRQQASGHCIDDAYQQSRHNSPENTSDDETSDDDASSFAALDAQDINALDYSSVDDGDGYPASPVWHSPQQTLLHSSMSDDRHAFDDTFAWHPHEQRRPAFDQFCSDHYASFFQSPGSQPLYSDSTSSTHRPWSYIPVRQHPNFVHGGWGEHDDSMSSANGFDHAGPVSRTLFSPQADSNHDVHLRDGNSDEDSDDDFSLDSGDLDDFAQELVDDFSTEATFPRHLHAQRSPAFDQFIPGHYGSFFQSPVSQPPYSNTANLTWDSRPQGSLYPSNPNADLEKRESTVIAELARTQRNLDLAEQEIAKIKSASQHDRERTAQQIQALDAQLASLQHDLTTTPQPFVDAVAQAFDHFDADVIEPGLLNPDTDSTARAAAEPGSEPGAKQLQIQIDHLTIQNSRLTSALASAQQEFVVAQQNNAKVGLAIAEAIAAANEEKAKHARQIQQLEQRNAIIRQASESAVEQLQAEIKTLKADLQQTIQTVHEKETAIAQHVASQKNVVAQVVERTLSNAQLNATIQELQDQLAAAKSAHSDNDAVCDAAITKIDQLILESLELDEILKASNTSSAHSSTTEDPQISALTQQLAAKQLELEALRAELERQKARAKKSSARHFSEKKAQKKTIQALQAELEKQKERTSYLCDSSTNTEHSDFDEDEEDYSLADDENDGTNLQAAFDAVAGTATPPKRARRATHSSDDLTPGVDFLPFQLTDTKPSTPSKNPHTINMRKKTSPHRPGIKASIFMPEDYEVTDTTSTTSPSLPLTTSTSH